jgi:hypothetical protein
MAIPLKAISIPFSGGGLIFEGLSKVLTSSETAFSLSVPPNIRHGAEIKISMEDIGLKDTHLHIQVLIDPHLEEDIW